MTSNIIPVSNDFGQRLKEFMERFGRTMSPTKVSYEMGTKYVKIISGHYGKQQVHGFIDFSGNLYKPVTVRMAKKNPSSSIYDDDFGLKEIDPIGVEYVR